MTNQTPGAAPSPPPTIHIPVRPEWLAFQREDILLPELPIVDAHHHLWDFPEKRYLGPDMLEDLAGGHKLVASVFVECKTCYRSAGPAVLRPLGEIDFVLEQARMAADLEPAMNIAAAIVGFADLGLGDAVAPLLTAEKQAGMNRLRGIRNISVWHADPSVRASSATPPERLLSDPAFRRGFRHLAANGLSFDAWLVHTQLHELFDLASAFPETPIVLNHVGGPLAIGPYRPRRNEVFQDWREGLRRLAELPNMFVKIGGFGQALFGFDFHLKDAPPDSATVAAAIRPYLESCLELFGARRCMLESNFPVDKGSFNYHVLWNAYKRLSEGMADEDRTRLFSGTASSFYRLSPEAR